MRSLRTRSSAKTALPGRRFQGRPESSPALAASVPVERGSETLWAENSIAGENAIRPIQVQVTRAAAVRQVPATSDRQDALATRTRSCRQPAPCHPVRTTPRPVQRAKGHRMEARDRPSSRDQQSVSKPSTRPSQPSPHRPRGANVREHELLDWRPIVGEQQTIGFRRNSRDGLQPGDHQISKRSSLTGID